MYTVRCVSDKCEGSSIYREGETEGGKERDLMDVRAASADRLPPKRLLVAIETPREEIKKGRVGKNMFFHVNPTTPDMFCTFSGRKCQN